MVISENYCLIFLLTSVLFFMAQTTSSPYKPIDNYLLACGSPKNVTFELRNFVPDSQHPSVRLKTQNSLVISSNVSKNLPPIYQSARIFKSSASYQFVIKQKGWHWIRLYFPPLRKNLESSVTVIAENLVLLQNFSFESSRKPLFKEFAINVKANTLTLTFVPSRNFSVFINAIEVVSSPDKVFSASPRAQNLTSFSFQSISHVAFETIYRISMGDSLAARSDIFHRTWQNDEKYLKTKVFSLNVSVDPDFINSSSTETAPKMVYATAKALKNAGVSNSTWVFSVNPKFSHILRLHFCDIIIGNSSKPSSFNVLLNSDIVVRNLNLSALTNGTKGVPFFIDFPSNFSSDSYTLSVTLEQSDQNYAILNGLEIMKIINKVRTLDGISSVKVVILKSASKVSVKVAIILGCTLGASVLLALIGIFYYYCMVARKPKTTAPNIVSPAGSSSLASPGRVCRIFTFQEILEATDNFEEKSLLGVGGFGKVYMGKLDDGTRVAVKRADPRSKQGLGEFQNEVRLLSKLRHRHLVALIGYCMVLNCNCPGTNSIVKNHEKMRLLQDKIATNNNSIPQFKNTAYHRERMELILVYEFMANGSLSDHLYGEKLIPLSWKQRLEICIGAARGLYYLHTGSSQSIIHRDVKVANILLDENFVAKVSDFGISRNGPELDESHVSTVVKGSFGYLDPEYFRTRHLTEKSDVYSFGVVLMEVLCGRPALDHDLPTMEKNLAKWVLGCSENGELERIIDRSLIGKAKFASIWKVWEVARKCLEDHRIKRPTMGYVMCSLEDALHLELRNTDGDGNLYLDCNIPDILPQECSRYL